jgi:hypothetical protein
MAAFLTVDALRAHAVPAFPHAAFGPAGNPVPLRPAARPRPALTAHWVVAPDGKLTCRWQTDGFARFGPPPH